MAALNSSGVTPSDTASPSLQSPKRGFSANHKLTPSELSSMDAEAEAALDEMDRLAAARNERKTPRWP